MPAITNVEFRRFSANHHNAQRNWLLVKLNTDDPNIYGLGDASPMENDDLVMGMVEAMVAKHLVGKDPLDSEVHWTNLYQDFQARGGRIASTALSGLDIAMWDLKGKILEQPVWRLLGGAHRRSIRVYANGWYTNPGTPEQNASAKHHGREHFYDVIGNHDASGADEPTQWWFKKWIDPTGESTEHSGIDISKRPYPTTGTWEHYSFEVGNVVFLMMADRNDGGPPIGRGDFGGYPAGAISEETFQWWTEKVAENRDKIVISAHHHMIKETTVASGLNEGCDEGYHGRMPDGGAPGSSFIYWVGGQKDSGRIENFLDENQPAIDLWLGAHTHTHPDDTTGGRTHVEQKWGANFVNVSAVTRYHGKRNSIPKSRLLTFTEGSDEARLQCYLHTDQYADQGWYEPSERTIKLRHKFEMPE